MEDGTSSRGPRKVQQEKKGIRIRGEAALDQIECMGSNDDPNVLCPCYRLDEVEMIAVLGPVESRSEWNTGRSFKQICHQHIALTGQCHQPVQ